MRSLGLAAVTIVAHRFDSCSSSSRLSTLALHKYNVVLAAGSLSTADAVLRPVFSTSKLRAAEFSVVDGALFLLVDCARYQG